MKIGVLGSGSVGHVLAAGFLQHGRAVAVGSRSPEKLADWGKQHPGAMTGTFTHTAAFGELMSSPSREARPRKLFASPAPAISAARSSSMPATRSPIHLQRMAF